MKEKIILKLITEAFEEAHNRNINENTPQKTNRKRSSIFIENIHNNFVEEFQEKEIQVSSNAYKNEDFNRREYLFDVLIAEIGYLKHKNIPYIRNSKIIIESEFARNIRESAIDFSKLVLSEAEIKIMILPHSIEKNPNEMEHYLNPLTEVAECVNGNLFVIFVPHPKNWQNEILNDKPVLTKMYKFEKSNSIWIRNRD